MGKKGKSHAKAAVDKSAANGEVINDSRFAKVHSDPRFMRLPKKERQVKVDGRFKQMFTDARFSSAPKFDSKGRRLEKKGEIDPALSALYAQSESEGSDEGSEGEGSEGREHEQGDGVEVSDAETDLSCFSDELLLDGEEDGEASESEELPTTDPTRRIAVMGLDWDFVTAVDILAVLQSFCPSGGAVERVTIYPSQYGLQQMEAERSQAPQVWATSDEAVGDADIDEAKLRDYEKQKLRYYFAVVECTSIKTAEAIYNVCDGLEFERTSNFMDLRFVPDDTEIPTEPHDTADSVPEEYEPPEFYTKVNQHTNVELSWDRDDPRRKPLKKKLTAEQLRTDHIKAFLASSDEESETEEPHEARAQRLRDLLMAPDPQEEDVPDKDMEVTFNAAFDELGQDIKQTLGRGGGLIGKETEWETYLRESKLKREKKADVEEDANRDGEDEDGDGMFISDESEGEGQVEKQSFSEIEPARRQHSGKKSRENKEQSNVADEKQRAELELLMMGDESTKRGFDLKQLVCEGQETKTSKKKSKKRKVDQDEETGAGDEFNIDVSDPRWGELFERPDFAIDKLHPRFKRTKNMDRLLQAVQTKHEQSEPMKVPGQGEERSQELSDLVQRVKGLQKINKKPQCKKSKRDQ